MQENEFEKRLAQEMEEFKLRPSDNVWEKVEEELRKKKKRRVVFFIFMLAGLSLLGYSGYFLTKSNQGQSIVQQNNNSLPGSRETGSANHTPPAPTLETEIGNNPSPGNENESTPATGKNSKNEKAEYDIVSSEKIPLEKPSVENRGKPISISGDKYPGANPANRISPTINDDNDRAVKTGKKPTSNPTANPMVNPGSSLPLIASNNVPVDSNTNGLTEISTNNKDSAIAAVPGSGEKSSGKKKQALSKIKWGIDLSIGKSSSRDNAFSLFSMDKSADMLYNSPVNNTGGGGGLGIPRVYPSDVKGGPGFRAGIMGEMKLSKRSSVSSGLQYVYHSNKIMVGYYSDTTVVVNNSFSQAARVDAIYRGAHQKEYTNNYHFIQIPLQYQWQLNKGVKVPITWNVGVSAAYLFSTNGLVYDTAAGGIYYRDNSAFNKFQFNLQTGFAFRFGNKNKVEWSIGPEISMGMNKLMKDDYTKEQYPLYGGVTGRIYFKKRK